MLWKKVIDVALQGLFAVAGGMLWLRRSCNDLFFSFLSMFPFFSDSSWPFSIFLSIFISFSKYPEAGLLILVSFWLDIYFSFFLAWICLLLLLPCNNNKKLTSVVFVVYL